jgi:uridine phosphorylase
VLDADIAVGHIIVPAAAVRDEGTSYHYLPPARKVGASPEAIAAIEKVLQAHNCAYIVSKTWTTDAYIVSGVLVGIDASFEEDVRTDLPTGTVSFFSPYNLGDVLIVPQE